LRIVFSAASARWRTLLQHDDFDQRRERHFDDAIARHTRRRHPDRLSEERDFVRVATWVEQEPRSLFEGDHRAPPRRPKLTATAMPREHAAIVTS
jgi:hypothetical protein